ncbi:uncharacterized protein B0H64DRAFT_368292 [Chaetomium fimeti]|uniref:Uncharacterized protein n=1 Tax=Chaetomium fimeti TaxID=1854472 RepID=A0AAE0H6E4_9PEZI|nr:hypothetical protein B0H64DRAFT_368292 [Chaetomium fimeti]
MVFSSPAWVPDIPWEIPDSIPLGQATLAGLNGDSEKSATDVLLVDPISGKSYSRADLKQRVEWLAGGVAKELGWSTNEGSPWDKVVAIYSLNTIDFFALSWAIHRLNGICLLLNPTSSVGEMISHMTAAKCGVIFTCETLVSTSVEVATRLSIAQSRIFTLPLPDGFLKNPEPTDGFKSLEDLVALGLQVQPPEPLVWRKGQAKEQVAYLCSTSGTSGKQKLAMITHYSLTINTLQMSAHENVQGESWHPHAVSGVLPFTHVYGLFIGHVAAWRGETLIVLPRFDMQLMLQSVQQYRIARLYLVPPIVVALTNNPFLFEMFDLSSVTSIANGASGLDRSLADKVYAQLPNCKVLPGYGLTETAVLTNLTGAHDTWAGSSGSLLPLTEARLVGPDGEEIESLDKPGEILFSAPNLFIGYLGNPEATKAAFDERGWLRTGDIGMFKKSPNGTEHLFVLDRIKDMIKVKGLQVVPVDIEVVLREHPAVADVAVIGVPDENAGERAKAFVVRSQSGRDEHDEEDLREMIDDYVQERLDETHWLHDRIMFVEALPKSASGKVLKRELRALAAEWN